MESSPPSLVQLALPQHFSTFSAHESKQVSFIKSKKAVLSQGNRAMALQGHPRSLILAPIESAYATSSWSSILTLEVLGPILPPFRDIAGFLLTTTPPLFHPNFRDVLGVPVGLNCQHCDGSEERRP